MQLIQIESAENNGSETQGELPIKKIETLDTLELDEAENELLFSSPKGEMFRADKRIEEQDPQLSNFESPLEEGSKTSPSSVPRRTSKFWQTPAEHTSSPFTPADFQVHSRLEGKNSEGTIVKDLQLFLNKDLESTPEDELPECRDDGLEQLTEELI